MTKLISDILRAPQPKFSHDIEKMERMSGLPGADIKLSLKLKDSTPRALRKLGLDPHDTSGEELYEALKHKLKRDNARITKMLDIQATDSPQKLAEKTISYINKKTKLPEVWQLKGTFLRKLLKKHPPRQLMKATGYRSVDSLLKREPLAEVIALGRAIDKRWYGKISEEYKSAKPTDIEQKKLNIIVVQETKVSRIKKSYSLTGGQILGVNELGSIVVIPARGRFEADVIASVVVLIETQREIKLTSSLLKFLTVRKDFGKLATTLITGGSRLSERILPLGWSSICRFAYRHNITPEFVQPHITQEDLDIAPSITQLCLIFPELHFWYELDYLAFHDGDEPVSYNLVDVVLNTCNNVRFEKRVHDYVRRNLHDELYSRYLVFPGVQKEMLRFWDE